ncbi:MAG: class I SAM-dependent methyltransferase [Candidatus Thorarchaeota archaeon]
MVPERPSEKYYRDTARFYDPFTELPDAQLYLELAKRFGSPILELASGTGRITFILAEAGYKIAGVELSPEMLDIAREKLQKLPEDVQNRVSLHQGDMTNFELDSKFEMVIVPWSFKFLLTTEDQLVCLRQVHKHLNDDGVFILDLYPHEITAPDETKSATVEINDATITRTYVYSTDLLTQQRYCEATVDIVHSNGDVENVKTNSVNALIMPREADLLVKAAGFETVEDYGGNHFAEYKPDDWKRVMVLKKRFSD